MSINPRVYSVFIGSPKGLEEERKCFYDRLNWFSQHYEHEEVLFRPVSSQEVPGGYGRPQEHINEVLCKCEYAVFILHDRMGTPPGGGPGSGTEEEFKLAKKLHKQGTIKSIALFMKEIDPARLAGRVGDWRAGLGRTSCSLLARSFVCECHPSRPCHVSSPRRVERSMRISSHCAHLFASPQGIWDLSCRDGFQRWSYNPIALE